jgi:hypothetical protein
LLFPHGQNHLIIRCGGPGLLAAFAISTLVTRELSAAEESDGWNFRMLDKLRVKQCSENRLLVVLCGFDFPRDQTHTKQQK